MAMAMGLGIAIPWTIAMLFCIQDMAAVQSAFLPSLEVFSQITGSKGVAVGLQAYMTFLYYSKLNHCSVLLLFLTSPSTQHASPDNG
jgi:choline transport protein